jgi:hypothetical protein
MSRTPLPSRTKIDDQVFRVVGTADHWTRNDRYLELLLYEAVCAHPGCGRIFRYKTTKTNFRRHVVNRRCEQHKAPGVPVPKKRKRKPASRASKALAIAPARLRATAAPKQAEGTGRPSYLD